MTTFQLRRSLASCPLSETLWVRYPVWAAAGTANAVCRRMASVYCGIIGRRKGVLIVRLCTHRIQSNRAVEQSDTEVAWLVGYGWTLSTSGCIRTCGFAKGGIELRAVDMAAHLHESIMSSCSVLFRGYWDTQYDARTNFFSGLFREFLVVKNNRWNHKKALYWAAAGGFMCWMMDQRRALGRIGF